MSDKKNHDKIHEKTHENEHEKEKLKQKKDIFKDKPKEPDIKSLKHQLDSKKREAEENKEIAQRIKAEFDNYKKRVIKDYDDNIKLANETLITRLLAVIDAFERALSLDNIQDEKLKSFYQGSELIYKQFMNILNEEGLKEIAPAKEELFDPSIHQAVLAEDLDDLKDHIVLEVFEKGYKLSDKLLRAAKVKVGNK
ncbi:MAG: nucleotide exchange factor GrpE [Spirochaetes bacterium]|nr:nucleotide exchange factor GrpE [Spirochaetota bacterium]